MLLCMPRLCICHVAGTCSIVNMHMVCTPCCRVPKFVPMDGKGLFSNDKTEEHVHMLDEALRQRCQAIAEYKQAETKLVSCLAAVLASGQAITENPVYKQLERSTGSLNDGLGRSDDLVVTDDDVPSGSWQDKPEEIQDARQVFHMFFGGIAMPYPSMLLLLKSDRGEPYAKPGMMIPDSIVLDSIDLWLRTDPPIPQDIFVDADPLDRNRIKQYISEGQFHRTRSPACTPKWYCRTFQQGNHFVVLAICYEKKLALKFDPMRSSYPRPWKKKLETCMPLCYNPNWQDLTIPDGWCFVTGLLGYLFVQKAMSGEDLDEIETLEQPEGFPKDEEALQFLDHNDCGFWAVYLLIILLDGANKEPQLPVDILRRLKSLRGTASFRYPVLQAYLVKTMGCIPSSSHPKKRSWDDATQGGSESVMIV